MLSTLKSGTNSAQDLMGQIRTLKDKVERLQI
jgi:hypothetical protein